MKFGLMVLVVMVCWVGVAAAGGCASGTALNSEFEGGLGSAPGGNYQSLLCFEVNNDSDLERLEIATGSIPIPESLNLMDTDLTRMAVVGVNDQMIATDLTTLARWGQPMNDSSAAIRWLKVVIPARVAANSINNYELRLYPIAPVVIDPYALSLSQSGNDVSVASAVAEFEIDTTNPRLFDQIKLDHDGDFNNALQTIYSDSTEAGPMLVYSDSGNQIQIGGGNNRFQAFDRIFSSPFEAVAMTNQGNVVVDEVTVLATGSVEAVVQMNGHFVAHDGSSLCQNNTTAPYEKFGFTVVTRFYRAHRSLALDFEFRNECSDATTGPWTDQVADVNHVSWSLPMAWSANQHRMAVDNQDFMSNLTAGYSRVDQHKGSGSSANWSRSASVTADNLQVLQNNYHQASILAINANDFMATVQMPHMKYREPQALQAHQSQLSAEFISENITLGEGKGIWNQIEFDFLPTALIDNDLTMVLQNSQVLGQLSLERGLLVRAQLADINQAKVLPSLGNQNNSLLKTNYLSWMNALHDETISEEPNAPGQWIRNKNFGSQYWPDTGGNDPFGIDAPRPNDSFSGMNYWDPAGLEILEFMRSGEPKWAWEIAIPVYKNMVHNAYLNVGFNTHGNRAGVAVQAGGPGCEFVESPPGSGNFIPGDCTTSGSGGGQWHRSAFGSDDYSYMMSLDLAYTARPDVLMRERFRMAGNTLVNRYDVLLAENFREDFVNVMNNTRQVIQHFEMLANCAEFVPGQMGEDCDLTLKQVVEELSRDNNQADLSCQGYAGLVNGMTNSDIPQGAVLDSCLTPQRFMTNALIYPFYHRYYLNYGDTASGTIREMLIKMPLTHYQYGIARLPNNDIDPFGQWWTRLFCQLNGSGTQVSSCTSAQDSDGNLNMYTYSKPATAAVLMMGLALDENNVWYDSDACTDFKNLFDTIGFTNSYGDQGSWDTVGHFNQPGWWKGSSLMMQSVIFAVGNYDTCQ